MSIEHQVTAGALPAEVENVWATLPAPLCDWFLLVPNYLTLQELVRLSAVSRRYREVFCLANHTDNQQIKKILASLLQREAVHPTRAVIGGHYVQICDQLPSIGNRSVAESLQQDPLAVAKLRKAALRRRKLVLIKDTVKPEMLSTNPTRLDITPWQFSLDTLFRDFHPKLPTEMLHQVEELGIDTRFTSLQDKTKFICSNQSGVDLYCHWIDYGGHLRIQPGDCVPSYTTMDGSPPPPSAAAVGTSSPPVSSFHVEHIQDNTWSQPPHIFIHSTMSSHAFALCYQEGGPPFAIYQCRRTWHAVRGLIKHVHAIAVMPGGHIQELHCNTARNDAARSMGYFMYDRATGVATLFPEDRESAVTHNHTPEDATESQAATLAEKFYGVDVPDFQEDGDEDGGLHVWRQARGAVQRFMGRADEPLNFPMVLSEAFYRNANI